MRTRGSMRETSPVSSRKNAESIPLMSWIWDVPGTWRGLAWGKGRAYPAGNSRMATRFNGRAYAFASYCRVRAYALYNASLPSPTT